MTLVVFGALCVCFVLVNCHPTVYKFNDNKALEPYLTPVSSTVIPIPIYKIAAEVNVGPFPEDDESLKKPIGPATLITANGKKKASSYEKPKPTDGSSVKQVPEEDFHFHPDNIKSTL